MKKIDYKKLGFLLLTGALMLSIGCGDSKKPDQSNAASTTKESAIEMTMDAVKETDTAKTVDESGTYYQPTGSAYESYLELDGQKILLVEDPETDLVDIYSLFEEGWGLLATVPNRTIEIRDDKLVALWNPVALPLNTYVRRAWYLDENGFLIEEEQDANEGFYQVYGGTFSMNKELTAYESPDGDTIAFLPQYVHISMVSFEDDWIYVEGENQAGYLKMDRDCLEETGEYIGEVLELVNLDTYLDEETRIFTDFIDMDQDGNADCVSLKIYEDVMFQDDSFYLLSINDEEVFGFAERIFDELIVVAINEQNVVVVTANGPSADPYSELFMYRDGKIHCCGGMEDYINQDDIDKDGMISTAEECFLIESTYIYYKYTLDEDGTISLLKQDAYEISGGTKTLKCELPLYEKPGGKQFVIEPQKVDLLKVSADHQYILVGYEGGEGWMKIEPWNEENQKAGFIVDLGLESTEVFDGLAFAG